jgi:hypothetical protein
MASTNIGIGTSLSVKGKFASQMGLKLPAGTTWASADNQPQDGRISDAEFTEFFIQMSS